MMMAAGSGQRRAIGLLGGCGARARVGRDRGKKNSQRIAHSGIQGDMNSTEGTL